MTEYYEVSCAFQIQGANPKYKGKILMPELYN